MAGFKTVSNIIKELTVLVLLGIEKKSKIVENVVKEIVYDYTSFDASRQSINKLVIFLNLTQSVIGPEVFEMLIDLSVETIWKGFILSKACK